MDHRFEIRELEDDDLGQAISVLCKGFPNRRPEYWREGLRRLAIRDRPVGCAKYGYTLDEGTELAGVVLTIPSIHNGERDPLVQVNISSWCALPAARGQPAKDLFGRACERDGVRYTDLSAAPHTIKAITAVGFKQWSAGQMIVVGAKTQHRAARRTGGVLTLAEAGRAGLSDAQGVMLADHERLGCLTLCLATDSGLAPLVFVKRRVKNLFPAAQLVYCDDLSDVIAHWRHLRPWLLRRGFPAMLVDCSGPLPGLVGRYISGKSPKYMKGPFPTQAVDHTYSEMVLLGF